MTDYYPYYEAFFQKDAAYYLSMLEKEKSGHKFTFNVYAFIFGIFWFLYRKVYLGALGIISFLIFAGVLEEHLLRKVSSGLTSTLISWTLTILIWTATGFVANYLYLRKAKHVVTTVMLKEQDHVRALSAIKKKGGTSYLFLLIIFLMGTFLFIYNNHS